MIYTELQTRISQTTHRSDLGPYIQSFIDDATARINNRFGLTLTTPVTGGAPGTDTNDVLTNYPLLYVYACLQSAFEHLNNGDNAIYMDNKWASEADNVLINNPTSAVDIYTTWSATADPIPPSVKWSAS